MKRPPAPQPNRSNPPANLGKGLAYSLLIHLAAVGPLVAFALVLGAREAALREDEVEVTWEAVDPASLPDNLPPLDAPEPAPPPLRPSAKPKLAEVKPEPAPEEVVPEAKPERQEPPVAPQPPETKRNREKVVELDDETDSPPPDKANFLANRNSRAEVETRAQDTNLERERKGEQQSSASENQAPDPGDAETKIAQLEDTPSLAGRRAPPSTPSAKPQAGAQPHNAPPTALSMRNVEQRAHTVTPETANPFLPRAAEGQMPLPAPGFRSLAETQGMQGPKTDPRLKLSADDYEYLFGEQDNAARALAEKARSQKKGRFTRRLDQGRSALENFIPEVQPGNQTALNARAAPFAAFIAAMHRSIHPLWGWGFLDDLEGRSHNDPLNNPVLETKVEIVLHADGTIDNVKVIRTSGLSMFDVAAVDVVYSGGPYPEPPREIRSQNGKIYLHWSFARDERQCATFGAEPFILDNPPAGSDKGGLAFNAAPKIPSNDARRLERLERSQVPHAHTHEAHGEEHETHAAPATPSEAFRPDDPLARHAAEGFFRALVRGDVRSMVKVSAFPFYSLAGNTTPSASVLQSQLQSLVQEMSTPRKLRSMNVYTGGGLRSAGVRPPEAFATNPRTLFAVAVVSGESLVAAMVPAGGTWKVVGLFR